jgi:hypothetical protein
MSEIFIDDNGTTSASVGFDGISEDQRVEQAKAELVSEQYGQPQPLILGKFTSQEALATSYRSLESETGKLRAELAALKAGKTPAAPAAEAAPPVDAPGEEAPPTEAPPLTAPTEPAAPAAAPEVQSIPIERQEQIRNSILAQAGGEDEFGKLATWASNNLTQDRLGRFNTALAAGNEADALTALKAIQFDRIMQQGYEPPLFGGSQQVAAGLKAFASEAEVVAAMQDPRYSGGDADPAYVQQVTERLAISKVFG